jgi:hypothetical protein
MATRTDLGLVVGQPRSGSADLHLTELGPVVVVNHLCRASFVAANMLDMGGATKFGA